MRKRATMAAMNLAVRKPMSLAEFLEWEERQELRYEFDGVEPSAMTGGTAAPCHHSAQPRDGASEAACAANPVSFTAATSRSRRRRQQQPLPGRNGAFAPPSIRPLKVVRDPVVIFEVLSPSTAAKDRIVKAREYQATPSVKRYVMLEQERIGATVLVRAQDGWSVLVLKDDDTLDMPEIGLAIPLAEFYEGLAFEAHPVEDNATTGRRPPPPDRFFDRPLP